MIHKEKTKRPYKNLKINLNLSMNLQKYTGLKNIFILVLSKNNWQLFL